MDSCVTFKTQQIHHLNSNHLPNYHSYHDQVYLIGNEQRQLSLTELYLIEQYLVLPIIRR
jgi:hypothetical protein